MADVNRQRAGGVDADDIAGRDDGGCLAFLDDRGAGDARAGRQGVAIIDGRIDEATVEPGRASSLLRRSGGSRAGLGERQLWHWTAAAHAERDRHDADTSIYRRIS